MPWSRTPPTTPTIPVRSGASVVYRSQTAAMKSVENASIWEKTTSITVFKTCRTYNLSIDMADDDWESIVIETGVDTLLNYLAENQEATVSDISDELGVSGDRIKNWAEALEEKGFVEKKYSARKGMILSYTSENKEKAEERLEELREQVEEESEKVEEELEERESKINEAKEKLKEMAEELEENRTKEEETKQNLEELEELEEELKERLQKQREREEKLHSRSVDLLSRIDSALNRIEKAEETAESFEDKKDEIRKKVKALKKLEKHAEKAEEVEDQLESLKDEKEEAESIFSRFMVKIGTIFPTSKNYDRILSGTVEDAKDDICKMDDPNYSAIVEAEKTGKNRETLIQWLESRQKKC